MSLMLLCSTILHYTKLCKAGGNNRGRIGRVSPHHLLPEQDTIGPVIYVPPPALATFCLKL